VLFATRAGTLTIHMSGALQNTEKKERKRWRAFNASHREVLPELSQQNEINYFKISC